MKVLLFIPEYPPYHIGGGGIVYQNLAETLQRKGFNVVVIWGYYPTDSINEPIKNFEKQKITFYQIPEIPYLKSFPYLRTAMPPNLRAMLSLPFILKKEKPDVIHFHGYGLPFIGFGSFLAVLMKIPYVFTIHGFPKSPENNPFFHLFWNVYQKHIMNRVLKKAKSITSISQWLRNDERLRPYQEKIRIIYNGIDIEKFNKFNQQKKGQEMKIIPKEAQYMVSVGRISEMKGFHLLIKILPRLLDYSENLYYVIIGDDDGYKNELIKLSKTLDVENHIIFTGFIDEDMKHQYIRDSDAYIVPSLWEPFGLTALEGLAMKKVVVTTGAGGLKEFLKKSSNVLFFNAQDEESLYQALITVLDKKVGYKEDNHLLHFTWDAIVEKYIDTYKQVRGDE